MEQEFDKYHEYLNGKAGNKDSLDQDMLEFLDKVDNSALPAFKKSQEDIWNKIDSAIEEGVEPEEAKTEAKTISWRPIMAVAAAVVLLIVASVIFINIDNKTQLEFATTDGEFKELVLPDGSKVTLNADSRLSYSESWDRTLQLDGEAFFEVIKGEKFTVQTPNGSVQVLGTSFNVFSREEKFEVACRTGKVQVDIPSAAFTETITKGQLILKDSDTVKRKELSQATIGNWTSGEFYYDSRPVREVFKEVKRQYKVKIDAKGVGDKLFSGYFINSDLELALSMICEPLDLTYQISEDKSAVVITSK